MSQGGALRSLHPLVIAAGVLVLVLIVEWAAGEARLGRTGTGVTTAPPATRQAGGRETAAAPERIAGWLQTVLSRPLMAPNRQPASTPSSSALALNGGLPRLAGTVTGGGTQVAIFARDDGGHPEIVRQGGTLGPYRVTDIAPRSVTLDGPAGRQVVHPSFGSATSPSDDASEDANTPGSPMMPRGMVPPNFPGLVQPMQPFPGPPPPAQPDDGSNP